MAAAELGGKLLCALDRGFGLSGISRNVATGCLKTSREGGAIGERTRGKSYLGKVFLSEILMRQKYFLFEKD